MASVVPMSFFTPDETINPNEYTFEIADAAARKTIIGQSDSFSDFYASVTAVPDGVPFTFSESGTISAILTNNEVNVSIKGVGVKLGENPTAVDLMFMSGSGGMYSGRYTLTGNSSTPTFTSRSLCNVRVLATAFDMNDIVSPGMYRADISSSSITNWPHSDGWLYFAVYGAVTSTASVMQVVYGGRTDSLGGRASYVRYRTNSTWGPWISLGSGALLSQGVNTVSKTVNAGGSVDTTANAAKEGYTPIGVIGWQSFSQNVFMYNCVLSGTTVSCGIHNFGTSAQTGSFTIRVLYIKN